MSSFKEQNEDYTIRFIGSLELMRNDLFKLEGQAALDAFDTLSPMAFKVDLWRFVVIFHIGGVYCDSKLTLEQPLDILLSQHRFTNIASQ